MNATTAFECDSIHELSQNVAYNIVLLAKFTICFTGAVAICVQWKRLGTRFLVHGNSQTVFQFYYFMNILVGLFYSSLYMFEFVRLRFDCVLIDFRFILIMRGLGLSASLSAHHLIVIMSIERLYSSIFPAHFERNSHKLFAAFLASSAIIITSVYVFVSASDDGKLFFRVILVVLNDLKIPQNAVRYTRMLIIITSSLIISLLVFLLDVYLNFYRKRRGLDSLAVKYQLAENRTVLRTLFPIEFNDSIIAFFTAAAQVLYIKLIMKSGEPSQIDRMLFLEYTSYSMMFPLILAMFLEWKVGRKSDTILPAEPNIDHFQHLQSFWVLHN